MLWTLASPAYFTRSDGGEECFIDVTDRIRATYPPGIPWLHGLDAAKLRMTQDASHDATDRAVAVADQPAAWVGLV